MLGELLADDDSAMKEAEARMMLTPAVRALPSREREILFLRFFNRGSSAEPEPPPR